MALKKESLEKLTRIYNFFKNDCTHEFANCYATYITEIIRAESGENKIGKFDIFTFAFTDKEASKIGWPVMSAILHENGYKIAVTNKRIIEIKADYPAEYEGKYVTRTGSFLDSQIKFPPSWQGFMPTVEILKTYTKVPIPDKAKFNEWLSERRAEYKAENYGKSIKYDDSWVVRLAEHTYIGAELFTYLLKAAEALGTKEVFVNGDRPAHLTSNTGRAIICTKFTNLVEEDVEYHKIFEA